MTTGRRVGATAALVLAGAVLVGACAPAPAAPAAPAPPATTSPTSAAARGSVLSVVPVARLDRGGVAEQLRSAGIDSTRVSSGVQAVRLEYATVGVDGAPTRASSLAVLPEGTADAPIRTVSWQHGTTVYRGSTASMADDSTDRASALMFASAGYLVSAPDYLGLGTGPGAHPYLDSPSSVSASLDALCAARAWASSGGRHLDVHVLLAGFSQGGPVTLALGRALQDGAEPGVVLGGLAAIDGPYDFRGTLATATSGSIDHATAYLSYLAVSWNRLHHLYDRPAEAFRDPSVEPLFSGDRPEPEVMAGLPPTVPELFTSAFLDRLRHPDGALRDAVERESATCDWSPGVPVALYHARGDRDVPFGNAEYCRAALSARGAAATVHDTGDVDHGTSGRLSLPAVLDGFAGAGG